MGVFRVFVLELSQSNGTVAEQSEAGCHSFVKKLSIAGFLYLWLGENFWSQNYHFSSQFKENQIQLTDATEKTTQLKNKVNPEST